MDDNHSITENNNNSNSINNNNYGEQCHQLLNTIRQVSQLLTSNSKNLDHDGIDIQLLLEHLNHLFKKLTDTNSKILFTGDLNSGKSTLVNALVKQFDEELLPADQQPCTSVFCEVSVTDESDVEMIHGIKDIQSYNKNNQNTYDVLERSQLYHIMTTEEDLGYRLLKIYTPRSKEHSTLMPKEDDEIVHITLVDSPGLNTDSVQTTAVYARQESIDVVVFVVNAENHFTLSGKEFLTNVANEKTQIFIVVNRFDNIRDKERCKRLILEQIRQLSPKTYENNADLVHFISAGHEPDGTHFIHMESCLRNFVLNNRTQSKLEPAKRYLENILADVHRIMITNQNNAKQNLNKVQDQFNTVFLPGYHRLMETKEHAIKNIGLLRTEGMDRIGRHVLASLEQATSNERMDQCISSIPTCQGIWQYANQIADALEKQLVSDLLATEADADQEAASCMDEMSVLAQSQLEGYTENMETMVNGNGSSSSSSSSSSSTDMIQKQQQGGLTLGYDIPHIQVETRDIFYNDIMADKRDATASGLLYIGGGLASLFMIKDMTYRFITRQIYRHGKVAIDQHRYDWALFGCATLAIVTFGGYTMYSYANHHIPNVIRLNLKQKFKQASLGFERQQTERIIRRLDTLLEEKQHEIQSKIQHLVSFKQEQYNTLQLKLQEAQFNLNHFDSLVEKTTKLIEL